MQTKTSLKNSEIKFQLGVEFQELRQDDKTVKTVINQDGNTLIQKQYGEPEVEIVREFSDAGIKTVAKVGNVVSTRVYKRL